MRRQVERPSPTRTPRRPFARALLVLVGLLPVPACLDVPRLPGTAASTPDPLAARVQKLGGTVAVDRARPGAPVVGVDLHRGHVGGADLEALAGFPELRSLNLYGTTVGDADMAHVGALTGLRTLYLNDTRVTDAGLSQLAKLTGLRELGLDRTGVTDDGLAAVGRLTGLEELTLAGDRVTDSGLKHLRGLRNLRHLSLGRTGVTTAGVQELRRELPNAKIVYCVGR